MKYYKTVPAKFISRANRFVAEVELSGHRTTVHVKNTGRCRELLLPGVDVVLEDFTDRMGSRRLAYDLIAVDKNGLLINMDSQAPNKVVDEAIREGKIFLEGLEDIDIVRPEFKFGDSRFDFYLKSKSGAEGFAEVKGVTLECDGVVSFPDAPTERGVKHLRELVRAAEQGYMSYVIFVVQMSGAKYFEPNDKTHKEFGDALRYAASHHVNVLAYECLVCSDSLEIVGKLPIRL